VRGLFAGGATLRASTIVAMAEKSEVKPKGPWTPEEIACNERVAAARIEQDREKPLEQRLEETLRLSRFVSELRQGVPLDVRAR